MNMVMQSNRALNRTAPPPVSSDVRLLKWREGAMFGFFKRRAVHYGESSVGAKKEQDEISIFEFHQKMNFSLFRNNDNVIKIKLPLR